MAILIDADRLAVWAAIMRGLSEPCATLKADLRAAVDAVDNWVEANTVSFNTAIPQPARGLLTARQKAEILAYVVMKRFDLS